jgi:acetyl-CoA carboxylase biotin carboxyl carrier protein
VNSERNLTFQDLVQLVELIKSSAGFSEFHLRMGDVELDLRRHAQGDHPPGGMNGANGAHGLNGAAAPAPAESARQPAPAPVSAPAGALPQPGETLGKTPDDDSPAGWPPDARVVKSPMVGTFYRASEPNAAPFVEAGAMVEADTTVCIIEVMKLMNSIAAGAAGVVTHILVEDGAPVEFGQPIIVIAPRAGQGQA